MSKFLQNHIGFQEFPVKKYFTPTIVQHLSMFKRLLISASAGIGFVVLLLGFVLIFSDPGESAKIDALKMGFGGVVMGGLMIYFWFQQISKESNTGRTQQYKYYKWGNITTPTVRQKEALQLMAFRSAEQLTWPETLEMEPSERRVRHIKDFRQKLDTLEIFDKNYFLNGLDSHWGIVTKKDFEYQANQLLTSSHTYSFLMASLDEDAAAMKSRLLDLTGLSEQYYDACLARGTGKPPKLIWAWEFWRLIAITRTAFSAELLDEEEAWNYIYKASDWAHCIFDDLEDFYNNMLLGCAFWSNQLSKVNEKKDAIATLKELNWPILHTSWTKPTNLNLPDYVQTGYQKEVDALLKLGKRNPIGFKKYSND